MSPQRPRFLASAAAATERPLFPAARAAVRSLLEGSTLHAARQDPASRVEEVATPEPPPGPSTAEQLASALRRLEDASADLAEQARVDAVEIAFQVARRIVEAELRSGPEPAISLARAAIRRAGESRQLVLRMHPEDALAVETAEGGAASLAPGVASIRVVPDPSLSRGDCVVEGDHGLVDGRLSTRLAQVRRAIEGVLEENAA